MRKKKVNPKQTVAQPRSNPSPVLPIQKQERFLNKEILTKPTISELVHSHMREYNGFFNSNLLLHQQLPRGIYDNLVNRINIRPIDQYDFAAIFVTATEYPTEQKQLEELIALAKDFRRSNQTTFMILASSYVPPKEYGDLFDYIIVRRWNNDGYKNFYRNLYSAMLIVYEEGFNYTLVTSPEYKFMTNNILARATEMLKINHKLFMTRGISKFGISCDTFITHTLFWLEIGLSSYFNTDELKLEEIIKIPDNYSFAGEAYEFSYVSMQLTANIIKAGYNIEDIIVVDELMLSFYDVLLFQGEQLGLKVSKQQKY